MKLSKRNGYYYRNDREYVSVTKFINETINKPAIQYWFAREAVRVALKNPEWNEKEVMAQVQLDVGKTKGRGKYIHSLAEAMPNVNENTVEEQYKGYFKALKSWWAKENPDRLYTEQEAYSDRFGYACRTDLVYLKEGITFVADFKTGKNFYAETGLQLAANRNALIEDGFIKDGKMVAVVLTETGEYIIKETNDSIEDVENVLKVWKWLKKKGGD